MKHMLDRLSGKPDKDDDAHAEAKMQVLHELRSMAMNMMGDKVKDRMPSEIEVSAPDSLNHNPSKRPVGPPDSLSADKDSSGGQRLDSSLPDKSSNHSAMDNAAGESAGRIALGRHEPAGDQGEPDQDMHNREYASLDDEDDMDDDEIDSMIQELQAKKQAKSKKAY